VLTVIAALAVGAASPGLAACSAGGGEPETPGLAARGTTVTTVKPTRQDLTNRVSLTGKVTINPVYGLVAPVDGEVRYLNVRPPTKPPTKPTRVATVWVGNKPTHVEVPAGSMFAGRLVDDRSKVTAGMPIVSAKYAGYGLVADLDAGQAYKIAGAVGSVQAQIKNGPGPFACAMLGTVAALPEGTVPAEPPPSQPPGGNPNAPLQPIGPGAPEKSDPTGLRLVCTAPADIRMINGAAATLDVVTEKATNVLVLPVEAVAGRQGKGKVDVVGPDGQRQTRDVELGLTDGKVIEIKSGLTGDENVAVPGPNLPPAKPTENGEPGPPGSK
jgi:multidrug efflux pump subunit AcrA (membrane-fusion protein)